MGFEHGVIKMFDFSHHFKDQRLQEMRHQLFVIQSFQKKSSQWFGGGQIIDNGYSKDQAVQIPNKKCGSLGSILIKELPEKEVINCIYLASSK